VPTGKPKYYQRTDGSSTPCQRRRPSRGTPTGVKPCSSVLRCVLGSNGIGIGGAAYRIRIICLVFRPSQAAPTNRLSSRTDGVFCFCCCTLIHYFLYLLVCVHPPGKYSFCQPDGYGALFSPLPVPCPCTIPTSSGNCIFYHPCLIKRGVPGDGDQSESGGGACTGGFPNLNFVFAALPGSSSCNKEYSVFENR